MRKGTLERDQWPAHGFISAGGKILVGDAADILRPRLS
jgi:hypothetical protein